MMLGLANIPIDSPSMDWNQSNNIKVSEVRISHSHSVEPEPQPSKTFTNFTQKASQTRYG